jgi:hypothetical protein
MFGSLQRYRAAMEQSTPELVATGAMVPINRRGHPTIWDKPVRNLALCALIHFLCRTTHT